MCGYHGAYRLYRRWDRRGRQPGLGGGAAGCRVDCGAHGRSWERRGAGLVKRQVDGFGLVLGGARLRRRRLGLTNRLLHLHLQVRWLRAVVTNFGLLEEKDRKEADEGGAHIYTALTPDL